MPSELPPLPAEAIEIGVTVSDWREAVERTGQALARSGATTVVYAAEMIRMIDEHGPYVVIAPGLALAHARPGPAVLADGLAVVTLSPPVDFGHPHNDPVRVVVGLAIATAENHLGAVAAIANIFNDSSAVDQLADATTVEQVQRVMAVEL